MACTPLDHARAARPLGWGKRVGPAGAKLDRAADRVGSYAPRFARCSSTGMLTVRLTTTRCDVSAREGQQHAAPFPVFVKGGADLAGRRRRDLAGKRDHVAGFHSGAFRGARSDNAQHLRPYAWDCPHQGTEGCDVRRQVAPRLQRARLRAPRPGGAPGW